LRVVNKESVNKFKGNLDLYFRDRLIIGDLNKLC